MAAGGGVAAPTNHDVVEVLVTSVSPLRGSRGRAGVRWRHMHAVMLCAVGQYQMWARWTTNYFWRVVTGNGRRHVIEQGRKQAHSAISAESLAIQCSTDLKNTGNSGNNGSSLLNGGLQALPMLPNCCHRFFTGNGDNQMKGKCGSLMLEMKCALPVVATFFIGWQRL